MNRYVESLTAAERKARLAMFAGMRPAWCDVVNDPIPERLKPQPLPRLGVVIYRDRNLLLDR